MSLYHLMAFYFSTINVLGFHVSLCFDFQTELPSNNVKTRTSKSPHNLSTSSRSDESSHVTSMVSGEGNLVKSQQITSPNTEHISRHTSEVIHATVEDYTRLLDAVASVDTRTRPLVNQTAALTLYTTFHLSVLLSVNEASQTIHVGCWVNFTWFDQLRVWNSDHYGGIDIITPAHEDIWHPKCVFLTPGGDVKTFNGDDVPIFLTNDGRVTWNPIAHLEAYCKMDFTYFPFDIQKCYLDIICHSVQAEVRIITDENDDNIAPLDENGEWDIFDQKLITLPKIWTNRAQSHFGFEFSMKRKPHFFIVHLLFPMISFSCLSSLVFILPRESGERASFSTAMQLALVVSMSDISELLDKTDTFPIIIIYVFCLLVLCESCVLITVIQLRILQPADNSSIDQQEQLGENKKKVCDETSIEKDDNVNINRFKYGWKINSDRVLFIIYIITWSFINTFFLVVLVNHKNITLFD